MLQNKYFHGCFKATTIHKLFLLQGTQCWLRPTACSELLAHLSGSAHTCMPAPTHLRTNNHQAAQGEQRAGVHLPTVTPSKKWWRFSGKAWSNLPAPVCLVGSQSAEYGMSKWTSASRQGDPPRDWSSETPSSHSRSRSHCSLQAVGILARRSTPSQTSPPFLMARVETGSQGSLQVVSPVSSMAISYFSIRLLVCSCHSWRA